MQYSFLMITVLSIILIIVFSSIYFFLAIREEATSNMRKNSQIARMIYDVRAEEVAFFTQNLASDRALQLLLDLDIRNKLSEYITDTVNRNRGYHITVFDRKLEKMTDVGAERSPLIMEEEKLPITRNGLAVAALEGKSTVGTELIPLRSGKNLLAISAAWPVLRDGRIAGGLLVRFLLNGNPEIVRRIKEKLGVEAAIVESGATVTATVPMAADHRLIDRMFSEHENGNTGGYYENIDMWFDGTLSEYGLLLDSGNKPAAALVIHVAATRYVQTFVNAIVIFLLIMAVAVALSFVFVHMVSKNIIGPVNTLLDGANRIAGGDLSHEIMINLKDEIGKLSRAFNGMRIALREKITTIEEMNQNLEATVQERTSTIESLMNSMKKYLPSQLYDAILGGTRNNDIHSHYRKKLTVFFSDVVGFTSTTESMEAEDLSELLNTYLDAMAKIAIKWGGTIDKFVGDAIMIFFGDPEFTNDTDHALRAVRMALEMVEKMNELRTQWADKGVEQPLHIRSGISTGYCTVGNFGSENRMDYTIIGSVVNLAARLEAAAEPDTILISRETYSLIKEEIECVAADALRLKGFSQPVQTFRIVAEKKGTRRYPFVGINRNGIRFREQLVDPQAMPPEERAELIRTLHLALQYARGNLKYVYDEKEKNWRLVRSAAAVVEADSPAS